MKIRNLLSLFAMCGFLCFPLASPADDSAIFGGGTLDVDANVLIIFDNSGSMGTKVENTVAEYDSDTQYTGPYNREKVYYQYSDGIAWYEFEHIGSDYEVDYSEIWCWDARRDLNEYGHWNGKIDSNDPHDCTRRGKQKILRTGNYLNYLHENPGAGIDKTRLQVAKEVVSELLNTTSTSGVRFGVMVFNNDQGGHVLAPIKNRTGSEIDTLAQTINGITAHTWTPLAETLAEAGLYFAGKGSWANSGVTYTSPIEWRCQKNYVIIMTDGEPTYDRGDILEDDHDYLDGRSIGDYDNDQKDPGSYSSYGSDYLDDVAKFLYDEDLRIGGVDLSLRSFDDDYPKQNVITYTVGFAIDHVLLESTADSNHGHGAYYTTEDGLNLVSILETIIASIMDTSVQFVSPVVPVNRVNRTYADNAMYLGLFLPDISGQWKGNLKKFGLGEDGMLLDRYGNDALDPSGAIKDEAKTCWSLVTGLEGIKVDVGGAGKVLLGQTSRTFYTRNTGNSLIVFNKTNILPTALGFADDTYTTQRDDLVDYIRADGVYSPLATGTNDKPRTWVLGDILHSEPAVLYDDQNSTNVIFVGANDGFLHCFLDNDHSGEGNANTNLQDDTLTEAWAFVPWDLLPNLKNLPPDDATTHITGDSEHDYFVDGSPVLFKPTGTPEKAYVVFGLRRGGDKYYCLNVSDYHNPTFAWEIPNNILGTGVEALGQSWCAPRFVKIKANSSDSVGKEVLLFAGGYDPNQDNGDPGTGDSKGRAVFAVEPGTTSCVVSSNINFNHNNYAKMTYSIIELNSFDSDDDGFEDTIYAGSLGGDLFVFSDRDGDGVWQARRLFSAANDGGTSGLRKFLKAPGVVRMSTTYDYVYIGSGNREDPQDISMTDRFYAIKNLWPATWSDEANTLTAANLVNMDTDIFNSAATEEDKTLKQEQLEAGSGWYLNMPNLGEKVVSSPIVFDKAVWFTTFTPTQTEDAEEGDEVEDKCSIPGGVGTARLYAINYKTGSAMYDLDEDGDKDRSVAIGGGIPSDPVIIVTKEGSYIAVGRQRGVAIRESGSENLFNKIYWIQE